MDVPVRAMVRELSARRSVLPADVEDGIADFMNSRVAEGAADCQRIHRIWDKRHRVRIAALAIAAVLLTDVIVC